MAEPSPFQELPRIEKAMVLTLVAIAVVLSVLLMAAMLLPPGGAGG